jgi:hypothetical protein
MDPEIFRFLRISLRTRLRTPSDHCRSNFTENIFHKNKTENHFLGKRPYLRTFDGEGVVEILEKWRKLENFLVDDVMQSLDIVDQNSVKVKRRFGDQLISLYIFLCWR